MKQAGAIWRRAVCRSRCRAARGAAGHFADTALCVVSQGDYYEAVCKAIDPVRKELVACFPRDAGELIRGSLSVRGRLRGLRDWPR